MDIPVDPERGLFARRAGLCVRDGHHPDIAAFVALADRFDRNEIGMLMATGVRHEAAHDTDQNEHGGERAHREDEHGQPGRQPED